MTIFVHLPPVVFYSESLACLAARGKVVIDPIELCCCMKFLFFADVLYVCEGEREREKERK